MPVDYPGPEKKWGLLIYVKPSFAGDEEIDLKHYRRVDQAFPHDPTTNQWFDETQVESYTTIRIDDKASERHVSRPTVKRWPAELVTGP
jgi:hypothetical protein